MPEAGAPILVAERLERSFGSGPAAVHAVRGVDLELSPGERVLIMGPSGSGKTTLVSMLGGLLTPDAGRVTIGDRDVYAEDAAARARLRLGTLGFVFQSFNLLSALSALENVEVPLRLAGGSRSQARERAADLLGRFGLAGRAGHPPRDLSGGEKQRVAIARALANEPAIVLADEPTANLDSRNGREVAEILARFGEEGKVVVIVSHDHRLVDIASRVVWIEDGRLAHRPGGVAAAASSPDR